MKIIVTSDIHGKKEIVNKLLYEYDADLYLDCGDSELTDYDLQNFLSVRGNCDYEWFPSYRIVKVSENFNIFITHGHLYTLEDMIIKAKENNCKVIIHGHTHKKRDDKVKEVLILNPGSISRPRSKDSNCFLKINYNENDNEIYYDFIKLML